MELTPKQIRQLQKLQQFRNSSPTVGEYFLMAWKVYFVIIVVGCIGIVFSFEEDWPAASGLFAGLVLMTLQRDFRWYKHIVRSWPLTKEITDWERVDELLKSTQTPSP